MSEQKKKAGFWSWLGLGKSHDSSPKEEQSVDTFQSPHEPLAEDVEEHSKEQPEEQPKEQLEQESPIDLAIEQENSLKDEREQEDNSRKDSYQEDSYQEDSSIAVAEAIVDAESAVENKIAVDTETAVEQISEAESAVKNEMAVEPETAVEAEPIVEVEQQLAEIEQTSESNVAANVTANVATEEILHTKSELGETQEKPQEGGFFSRLVKGLLKTKQNIGDGFRTLFFGKKIDDDLFEELEEQLLIADIGVPTTSKIIERLTQHASHRQLKEADWLYQQLKVELGEILKPVEQPLQIDSSKKPYVILMVGVNGVGKTTTIGKMARQFQSQGKSVMLAAGDTFRAAAVEQLQVWGERNHIPVVAQSTGADSASVIFDAMQSAAARNVDILIADTAGRLQNKNNLMDELKKIVRVMKKYDETAPHEIMLTLDAGTGQNAISQAKLFNEAVGLTGISLTKLDGTAKGGVIFAIADQFNLPIRYIGVGEKIEDLRPFQAEEFIEALFSQDVIDK